ncbi:zinc transporter 1 [Quercus suber]|uniref:Zinc transporter 1 n=1 Tax=Quercus suber TaxID=58331 RepID=A0AAW0KEA4_QUESU
MTNFQISLFKFLTIFTLIFLVGPIQVSSKCTCESQEEDGNISVALKYKLVSIVSILLASTLGVSLPFLVKRLRFLNPEKDIYFLIKAFDAGVILATRFIHVLPDAYQSLNSPCLSENPWGKFPFTGFVAMVSAIGTLLMEAFATGYQKRSELRKAQPLNADEEESDEAHAESVDDSSEVEGIELGTFGQPISPPPGFSGNDDEHANFHDIDDLSS